MNDKTIALIGLGMIGGSIAKAIRSVYPHCSLIACDTDQNALSWAEENHIIDKAYNQISSDFSACDIIFLCTPVEYSIEYLAPLKHFISSHCILTDVGSVKAHIHTAVENEGLSHCFIGGHPMAGSEKSGVYYANERLLENAYYLLTPSPQVSSEKIEFLADMIASIHALPLIIDNHQHDYTVANISHLPHIIAAGLVNMIKYSDNEQQFMKQLAAGGFKDITRIASSSSVMWQQICMTNDSNIVPVLDNYITYLEKIKKHIAEHNEHAIYNFFDEACQYRNSIPNQAIGPIQKIYELYVDIIDESGAIATLATMLASNGINIKNIGITHNREFQDGVLRIELNDDDSINKAKILLKKYMYEFYTRD